MEFVTLPVVTPLVTFGGSFIAFFIKQQLGDAFMPELTPAQLDLALAKALETDEGQKELQRLFGTLDRDGNGKVTSDEWASALTANRALMLAHFGVSNKVELQKQFVRLDVDGSKDLTWEEFSKGAASAAAAVKLANSVLIDKGMAEWKQLWDTLDKDGDGRVTYDEFGVGVFKNQRVMKKFYGKLASISHPKQTVALKATLDDKQKALGAAAEEMAKAEVALAEKNATAEAAATAAQAAEAAATAAEEQQASAFAAVLPLRVARATATEALAAKQQQRQQQLDEQQQKQAAAAASAASAASAATPSREKSKKGTPGREKSSKKKQAAPTPAAPPVPEPEPSAPLIDLTESQQALDAATKAVEDAEQAAATAASGAKDAATERVRTAALLKDARAEAEEWLLTCTTRTQAHSALQAEVDEVSHRYEQSRMADEAVVKEIALTFQRLDADKNGALSWEEFTTGVNALTTLQSLEA